MKKGKFWITNRKPRITIRKLFVVCYFTLIRVYEGMGNVYEGKCWKTNRKLRRTKRKQWITNSKLKWLLVIDIPWNPYVNLYFSKKKRVTTWITKKKQETYLIFVTNFGALMRNFLTSCASDMGRITCQCNALHYNYFRIFSIILHYNYLNFTK